MRLPRLAISSVLILAALPGCMIFGPCGKKTFKLLPKLNSSFHGVSARGVPIFVDPCPLFSPDCGDAPPAFPIFPTCGLALTDECGCNGEGPFLTAGASPRAITFSYGPPALVLLTLHSAFAGLGSSVELVFQINVNQLQTFHGVVTVPDDFGFHGFTALGPADTQIGVYGFDIDRDGIVDLNLPLRARDFDHAYVDVDRDGGFDAGLDGTIEHTTGGGFHTFTIDLPLGGDGNAQAFFGPLELRVFIALYAGILTNGPEGFYTFNASFTSVDQDTGGASDNQGNEPHSFDAPSQQVTVFASPLTGFDQFLCYKAKPSKTNICAPNAVANAGAACATDADCGGTSGACVKNVLPKGLQPFLEDEIEAKAFELKKPFALCNPAGPDGMVVADEDTHFRSYRMKEAKTTCAPNAAQNAGHACTSSADCGGSACGKTPKHVPARSLRIINTIGTVVVDTAKPDTLFVPTAKSLAAPAAPLPTPAALDHFKCYTVKLRKKVCAGNASKTCKRDNDCDVDGPCLLKFRKDLQATVQDQFTGTPKTFVVKKPTRLCTAVDKNGEGLQNADRNLLCYQVKPVSGAPAAVPHPGVHLTNQFGRELVDTGKEVELCVPSVRAL